MTQYQVVYGRIPMTIVHYLLGSSKVAVVEEALVERDALLRQLKKNLIVAKYRMETQANKSLHEVEFNSGDMLDKWWSNEAKDHQRKRRDVALLGRGSSLGTGVSWVAGLPLYMGHIISGKGVEMDQKGSCGKGLACAYESAATDALDARIGAVLMQRGQPISYFCRKLGPRIRVVATYQKELFAIVESVYKWRQYLVGLRFTIRTDHRSLNELMQQVIQRPFQQKYVRKLMGFDFVIEYKPGVTNRVVDALSCMFKEEEDVVDKFMTLSQPLPELISEIRQENETLNELQQIHQKLDHNELMEGVRQEQDRPQHWVRVLQLAEYSYNTSFHSSIKMSHYQVVYGRVPPIIVPYLLGSSKVAAVENSLVERNALLRQLKQNLLVDKHRMEMQANRNLRDVEFKSGEMIRPCLRKIRDPRGQRPNRMT
nr:Ty3/gypsy retrotransposon protein [Tanacetum cinerariifolium]